MVQSEEAAFEFLVSDEELAQAVEPAMADLDDPATRLLAGVAPLGIGFFAPIDDVSDIAMRFDDCQCALASIARIGAQVLAAPGGRLVALDHDGVKDLADLGDVMRVGAGHDERQRDATAVDQQVTLASLFFPDRSGCFRPPLAPRVP